MEKHYAWIVKRLLRGDRMAKRYYWLKLNENFFERDEIKVMENSPNGKDYIIFYLKLLLKSISSEGKLKFRNVIPYTPEILSSITNTNIDTVRVAIKMFTDLGLMELWDDGTMFMAETQNMIGSETEWAKKKREYRKSIENTKKLGQSEDNVQDKKDNVRQEKEIEIEIDKDLEKESREKNSLLSEKIIEILKFYEEQTCSSIASQYQLIEELFEPYDLKDIKEALCKALSKGKKGKTALNYAKGILKNWADEGKEEQHGTNKANNTGSKKRATEDEGERLLRRAKEITGGHLEDPKCDF